MDDKVNADNYSRQELDKLAAEAGLTDAGKYGNKPAVADAINRVRAGEDAATVNAELAPSPADSEKPAKPAASAADDKKIHAVNGGHPTQFDEIGNPVYDSSQV